MLSGQSDTLRRLIHTLHCLIDEVITAINGWLRNRRRQWSRGRILDGRGFDSRNGVGFSLRYRTGLFFWRGGHSDYRRRLSRCLCQRLRFLPQLRM